MSFRNNSNFINNGVMEYTCNHCEVVFSDKSELLLHVEIITDEKPYQCADCDKNFANTDNLRIHLATQWVNDNDSDNESNTRDSNGVSAKTDTLLTDS